MDRSNPNPRAIQPAPRPPNPYFQLVGRRFSEPLLLLLVFVVGVWLWDNHLGPTVPYGPGDWRLALTKADRDLRLADQAAELPGWMRPVLAIDTPRAALDASIRNLEELERAMPGPPLDHDSAAGLHALEELRRIRIGAEAGGHAPPSSSLLPPPDPREVRARLLAGHGHCWDLAYLRAHGVEAVESGAIVERQSRRLFARTVAARGTVAVLALAGLLALPHTLLAFLRAPCRHPRPNYAEHWQTGFGLGVFLVAFLSSIGAVISYQAALEYLASLPGRAAGEFLISPPVFVLVDSGIRLLPALIALAILFRRPRHAIQRLGLAGPLRGRMVLGSFALLQVLDFGLRTLLGSYQVRDPLGGLSAAEAGPWGLVFGIVSACLVAPFAEEILYRGVLFRSLANGLRLPAAVILSSFLFAAVHFYPLPSLALIFAVGATCALCYAASGSLLTAVALHALYNAAIKIPEWVIYHSSLSW